MTGSWLEDLVSRIGDGTGYVCSRLCWADAQVLERAGEIFARCAAEEKAHELDQLLSIDVAADGLAMGADRAGRLFLVDPWEQDDAVAARGGMVLDDAS